MSCLNGIEESGDGEKFIGHRLSYVDDKIKDDNHENISSRR